MVGEKDEGELVTGLPVDRRQEIGREIEGKVTWTPQIHASFPPSKYTQPRQQVLLKNLARVFSGKECQREETRESTRPIIKWLADTGSSTGGWEREGSSKMGEAIGILCKQSGNNGGRVKLKAPPCRLPACLSQLLINKSIASVAMQNENFKKKSKVTV